MTNETIEVDIPEETIEILLRKYITDTLTDASSELYDDQLAEGKSAFEAAGNAVFNELMIDIVKRELSKDKYKEIRDGCEHNWVQQGHGHNYDLYICTTCGETDER